MNGFCNLVSLNEQTELLEYFLSWDTLFEADLSALNRKKKKSYKNAKCEIRSTFYSKHSFSSSLP